MIALQLILVHLIGDFFLQPKSWVEEKEKKTIKSPKLYYHVGIHALLTFLVLWFTNTELNQALLITAIIFVSHLIIDATKLLLQSEKKSLQKIYFIADQILHFLVIGAIWYTYEGTATSLDWLLTEQSLLAIICLLFITKPLSIVIRVLISDLSPEKEGNKEDSLANAGKFIGILERLLIFGFVVSGNWGGVGFLLAAKSVFRFGDLKDSQDRKLTEYILIGTLLSFGLAILTGVIYTSIASNL